MCQTLFCLFHNYVVFLKKNIWYNVFSITLLGTTGYIGEQIQSSKIDFWIYGRRGSTWRSYGSSCFAKLIMRWIYSRFWNVFLRPCRTNERLSRSIPGTPLDPIVTPKSQPKWKAGHSVVCNREPNPIKGTWVARLHDQASVIDLY